jgi:hypothetical protein
MDWCVGIIIEGFDPFSNRPPSTVSGFPATRPSAWAEGAVVTSTAESNRSMSMELPLIDLLRHRIEDLGPTMLAPVAL